MRALVQRVLRAAVTVDGETTGSIGPGMCVFVGVTHGDSEASALRLADRLWGLRIFDDASGVMNLSLADQPAPAALVVSQFTLYGDTSRGRRPSWVAAAPGPVASPLVATVASSLSARGATVGTGVFGAHMEVSLVNDGPVTVMLEVPPAGG